MRICLWNVLSAAAVVVSAAASTASFAANGPPELQQQNVHIVEHRAADRVRFIGTRRQARIVIPGVSAATPPGLAGRAAVERYGSLFGVTRADEQLQLIRDVIKPGRGSRHRYRQIHQGVPVLAGELLVNLDGSRRLLAMLGEISGDVSVSTRPSLTPTEAENAALAAVAKWYGVSAQLLQTTPPTLWIVDPQLLVSTDRPATLTWRIEVTNNVQPRTLRELLFIDAQAGGVTLHVNLIERVKNRETYTASNTSALPGTLVCDESDPTCAAGDADAVDAHLYAGDSYDFFFNEHGRDSLDDAGQTLVSTVHWNDGIICPNAFWDGTQMAYCDGMVADDVVGHELTHGVTQNTSNLFYYYQSGAINESFSDIWGEFIDQVNGSGTDFPFNKWQLGEDLPPLIGVIRDMSDPTLFNDPDKMSSPLYETSGADNGGVHTNSGVNNKAAYLMTDGGTFNTYTINGLGIGKVADIYYEAQTNLLVSGSDYADLYEALNQACSNLDGIDGITPSDCAEVSKATDAVEMNTDPNGLNPDAAICPGGEQPDDLLYDDIENGTVRWLLTNLAGNTTPAWIADTGYTTSGQFMLWGRDSFPSTDAVAEFNVDVVLPATTSAYLHFNHAFGFEYDGFTDTYFDGGWIEYSTDSGATWNDAETFIEDGQTYNATLAANNPHPSQPAFGS
ncbi:MAG: M4 family metallopeptidase, partial [Gammaproteobacteria bacterium]|nr:M4 family metallopeptidase [Gammaproteobacteria bacterium]